MIILMNTN